MTTLVPHFTHLWMVGEFAGFDNDGHPLHRWTLSMRVHGPTRGAVRDWLDQLERDTSGTVHLSTEPVPVAVKVGGAYQINLSTLPLRGSPSVTLACVFDLDREEVE